MRSDSPAGRTRRLARLLLIVAPLAASPLAAQRVQLRTTTTARYIELQPIVLDPGTGDFRAGAVEGAAPFIQDLEVSAWGLGIEGLRAYGQARLRGSLGSDLVWPRADDHFDLRQAFVELERGRWRARAGRQERVSGLGVAAFDGGSVAWRPLDRVRVEGFFGRGLARGFLEPLTSDAIRAIDPLGPGTGTLFMGLTVAASPLPGWRAAAAWQKELLADRSGLVSERVGFDARGSLGGFLLTGSIDGDLAAEAVGRARIAVGHRIRRAYVEAEAFRYRPVFDLTTIWGVFSPEGHEGAGLRADLPLPHGLLADGGVVVRHYRAATETTPFLVGVGDYSTAWTAGLRWQRDPFVLGGRWRLLKGYGGSHGGGEATFSWTDPAGRWSAGGHVSVFREVEQFRIADGVVTGGGAHGEARLTQRLTVRGELARYWHRPRAGDAAINWSQLRALLEVQLLFGADADRVPAWH